jgi:hypothetical protein
MSSDEVKAVRTSRALNSVFCTTAGPVPICAKYWPNRRNTLAMATKPKALGVSRRASTAVTPICNTTLTMLEA